MSSTGIKLPLIKSFGRKRDYLSFQGWGRKGGTVAAVVTNKETEIKMTT
jgi:hypothetical protein